MPASASTLFDLGAWLTVDMALCGVAAGGRPVALEVQGKRHYTDNGLERPSSVTARLLREHAGWHVIAVPWQAWQRCKGSVGAQQTLLKSLLRALPEHALL